MITKAEFSGPTDAESHACCPNCSYDLTGLPTPRCPECGLAFSWDDLPRLRNLPTIPFERAAGWGKVVGFVQTAAMVLITPWIFARQCARRMDWRMGLLFGGVCFASTVLACVAHTAYDTLIVWNCTAAIYVLAQACMLAILDWPHWRDGAKSWLFWLGVSGYTSAVMLTEFYHGPPMIELQSIIWLFRGEGGGFLNMPSEPLVHWMQLAVWIAGLACIFATRLRSREAARGRVKAAAAAAAVVVVVYVMYALAIEQVGMRIYNWLN